MVKPILVITEYDNDNGTGAEVEVFVNMQKAIERGKAIVEEYLSDCKLTRDYFKEGDSELDEKEHEDGYSFTSWDNPDMAKYNVYVYRAVYEDDETETVELYIGDNETVQLYRMKLKEYVRNTFNHGRIEYFLADYIHEQVREIVFNHPEMVYIPELYEEEELTLCFVCGQECKRGYVIENIIEGDRSICSDECLNKEYTEDEYKELCNEGVVHYTEWN